MIVDIEKIKDDAAKKKEDTAEIVPINIDGVDYFRGKIIKDVFSDYGECLAANQRARAKADYKRRGLDEVGRTPAEAERSNKVRKLIEERNELMDGIRKVEEKIAAVNRR